MRLFLKLLLKLFYKTKISGLENFKFNGPALIMPNHVSFLDPVILYAYLPKNVCFVVNTAIAEKFQIFLRWVNHVTVDPLNPYSLKRVIALAKSGTPVVIFPEGRITTTGGLMKVYGGIALIALKANAKIYPVILTGPELSLFSRITDKVRWLFFPKISIHIFSPIKLDYQKDKSFRQQEETISDMLLELMQLNLFKALQKNEKHSNLFDKLLEVSKVRGASENIIEDITGSINYKKCILSSYILGDKFNKILGSEKTAGVLLPNSIGHFVTLFALFYAGKTPAIMNFTAGNINNKDCAEAAEIHTIFTSRAFIEKGKYENLISNLETGCKIVYLEDIKNSISALDKLKGLYKKAIHQKACKKSSSKLILFTSGSESKPKGVLLSHTNIMSNINQMSCVIDFTPRDKMLNVLPMFHSFGLTAGTLLPALKGFQVYLYPTPLHYKVIPEVAYDRNCTVLLGTPTFLDGYGRQAHHYDFYKIRYVIAGGERLKEDIKQLWMNKFGIRILEGYGTTETSPVLSFNTPLFNKSGTVGKLLPGIKCRIEAVEGIQNGGNLLVSGPNIMEGYLLYQKGFVSAQRWYNTGDIVSLDPEKFISIKSRLKRFAKISGEMVSLDAVEKIAAECFGTDSVASVNLPDDKKGEKIILYTSKSDASKQTLRDFLINTGYNTLTLPDEIIFIEKLPLLGNGKTDYVSLHLIS